MKDNVMEQIEFEAAIKDYVIKVVDPNNPQIVSYPLKTIIRRRNISISDYARERAIERRPPTTNPYGVAVITPVGKFKNATEAAEALGISKGTLYYRIKAMEGYEYAN